MTGRDPKTGRFLPGNKFAKGRPPKKYEIELYESFNKVVTKEDWEEIIRIAVKQAKRGDKWARDFLADRVLGKPMQSIDIHAIADEPDEIIRIGEVIDDDVIDVEAKEE
jgi:hypothetical protein